MCAPRSSLPSQSPRNRFHGRGCLGEREPAFPSISVCPSQARIDAGIPALTSIGSNQMHEGDNMTHCHVELKQLLQPPRWENNTAWENLTLLSVLSSCQ